VGGGGEGVRGGERGVTLGREVWLGWRFYTVFNIEFGSECVRVTGVNAYKYYL
jgi:hypothetical protein